jgi:hypothetical protein
MKDTSVITSVVSKVRIPTIVSKIERELYCQDLDTFQTYTIQSTVKGNLEIHYLDEWERMETLRMPVAPSFLVTCTKRVEEKYRMEFISSLN